MYGTVADRGGRLKIRHGPVKHLGDGGLGPSGLPSRLAALRHGARHLPVVNNSSETPDLSGLFEPGSHGSLASYAKRIWSRREYVMHVPWNELRSQQMNTVLGNLWHLFNPILSIAVYAVIFGVVLKVDRGVDNFVAFLAVGVFVFSFTQKGVTTASQSLVKNRGLLRSISFPRALLPMTSVITELLAFVPGLAVMLLTALITGESPRWSWLLIPVLIFFQTILTMGGALLTARAASEFGDVKNVLPFLFRLLFYGSGVLFSVDAYLEDDSALRLLFLVNPMFDLLEVYRWAMFGLRVELIEVAVLGAWTVGLMVAGVWWFRRGEATYGS